ncbi:hypothetical protein WG66_010260 [Moniliophthora roreri]|nr:hypothetical protein WG66_010260 [Moniliophthora roreri]
MASNDSLRRKRQRVMGELQRNSNPGSTILPEKGGNFPVEFQSNGDVALQRSTGEKLVVMNMANTSSPLSTQPEGRQNESSDIGPYIQPDSRGDQEGGAYASSYMRETSTEGSLGKRNDDSVSRATSDSPEAWRITPTSTLPPLQSSGSWRRDCFTESCATTPLEEQQSVLCVDRTSPFSDMNNVTKLTKKPSHSLANRAFADLSNLSLNVSLPSTPTTKSPPTQKSLRRKKHLSVLRMSAPLPTHPKPSPILPATPVSARPQSQPFLSQYRTSPEPATTLSVPITSFQAHSRVYSQPNVARLGHPSRPYYSAIRKDVMSPPSPNTMPPPSSFPLIELSDAIPNPIHSGLEDDLDFAQGCASLPRMRHRSAPAFSQRERLELRLALEKDERVLEEDGDSSLDMGRLSPRTSDTLRRKVDKLRRGIRDIWRRRS